jgi:hypothetical protein
VVRLSIVAAIAGIACDGVVIAPVVDIPTDGDATPYPIDAIELSLWRSGDPLPLASKRFTRGQTLELADVAFDDDLVLQLRGFAGVQGQAFGKTCPFAIAAGEPEPVPHVYFARIFSWGDVARPARVLGDDAVAIARPDGSALIAGGRDDTSTPILDVDVFDPRAGGFSPIGSLTVARSGARAAVLGDGRIVIAGGTSSAPQSAIETIGSVGGIDVVELLQVDPLVGGPLALTALTDGRVAGFGGRDTSGAITDDVFLLDDAETLMVYRSGSRRILATARERHTATRLSDDLNADVLIVGGFDGGAAVARAELYKPLAEQFADPASFVFDMKVPRFDHRAIRLLDGSVLVVGGFSAPGVATRTVELFSLDAGFRHVGPVDGTGMATVLELPSDAGVTDQIATLLPDGRVLLAGGRDAAGNAVDTAYILDLVVDNLVEEIRINRTRALAAPRAGPQAVLMCDATVLIVGGTTDPAHAVERYNTDTLAVD